MRPRRRGGNDTGGLDGLLEPAPAGLFAADMLPPEPGDAELLGGRGPSERLVLLQITESLGGQAAQLPLLGGLGAMGALREGGPTTERAVHGLGEVEGVSSE